MGKNESEKPDQPALLEVCNNIKKRTEIKIYLVNKN